MIEVRQAEERGCAVLRVRGPVAAGDIGAITSAFSQIRQDRPVFLDLTGLAATSRHQWRRLRRVISTERAQRPIAASADDLDTRMVIERLGLRGAFPPVMV